METHPIPSHDSVTGGFVINNGARGADEVRAALRRLLVGEEFSKSQRTSRLLQFLVEKCLAGALRETSEYAIGLAVFDRDPTSYSTAEDPIVRIQMGRLREKLKAYYADGGAASPLRFVIPLGSYMPLIVEMPPPVSGTGVLAVVPLAHSSADVAATAFAQGLDEELSFQLFKGLGHRVLSYTDITGAPHAGGHRLEGSIRGDDRRIRASLRLVDTDVGCIEWAEQFDRAWPCEIAVHEELAIAVCGALRRHFGYAEQC